MSSPSVVQGDAEMADEPEDVKKETATIEPKDVQKKTAEPTLKRKRKVEDNIPANILTEVFLRIFYPISSCMSKSVSIGLMKSLDYSPTVMLNHGTKMILFSENAWESFSKHLHLIECYFSNSVCGRKIDIRILDCDNEIDDIKQCGQPLVRIRDLSHHDNKILLSREEFYILNHAASPITRYMKQLVFSSLVITEYLVDTLEKQPNSTIIYGHVDTSIFNRLPQEVEMWRELRNFESAREAIEEEETDKEETNTQGQPDKQEETQDVLSID